MTNGSAPESYSYDADGERVTRTAGGVTTVYLGGTLEQTGTAAKRYYSMGGQVVAVRAASGVTYLHGDHLGSVSAATDSSGTAATTQEFDPWGRVRSGGIGATSMNYTGQRLDATGLLYYHARYYNPVLARFVSADSVVPGNASGGMDGVALKGLTVDFHEPGFAAQLGGENNQPFWFQMSDEQRQKAGDPWGPKNPQALNRYSYVLNGPMKATDPSGHSMYIGPKWANKWLTDYQKEINNFDKNGAIAAIGTGAGTGGLLALLGIANPPAAFIAGGIAIAALEVGKEAIVRDHNNLIAEISRVNSESSKGFAIKAYKHVLGARVDIMNLETGEITSVSVSEWGAQTLSSAIYSDIPYTWDASVTGHHFEDDDLSGGGGGGSGW